MPHHRLLVNPTAGRGRTQQALPRIRQILEEAGVDHDVRLSHAPGDAEALAREAAREEVERLVVVGGDGTLQEAANGILAVDPSLPLAIVPTGSGNDFAKAAGVPADLDGALATALRGEPRPVDVGRLGPRVFVNGLGIGLDGDAAHRYARMRRFKGEVGYLLAAVSSALRFRAIPVKVTTPDWSFEDEAIFVGATNGHSHGGDFKICPTARVDDGLLDVYVFTDMFPLKRLLQVPKVQKGEHTDLPEYHHVAAPWVEFELDRPVPAHLDGEPEMLRASTYRVEVGAGELRVVGAGRRMERLQ